MKVPGGIASKHDSMCWESQPSSPPVLRLGGLRLRVKQPMRSPLRIESGVTIKGNAGFTLKRMCHVSCDLCSSGILEGAVQ
jgi:hypothetical protein